MISFIKYIIILYKKIFIYNTINKVLKNNNLYLKKKYFI